MYVHGHGCKHRPSKLDYDFRPTLLFTSEDGVSWKHEESALQKPPYLLWDLFHLSNPVLNARDWHYYALARIVREEGSVVLCRSPSIEGPYEQGPRLGRSIRNFHLFDVGDGEMYVLFSMTGDRPERILLGSVNGPASSANWTDWKLLPGPRILRPEYWYEHGNAEVTTSKPGLAESRHRVSDPRILLDERDSSDNATRISGLIFYSVQGERGIAAARVSIDLDSYRNVTSYRDHANIRPMEGVPSDLNSLYAGATASELQKKNKVKPSANRTGHDSWASLAVAVGEENFKYIRIARTMARQYGYDASSDDDYAPCGYYCKFMGNGTEKDEEKGTDWDCFIAYSM